MNTFSRIYVWLAWWCSITAQGKNNAAASSPGIETTYFDANRRTGDVELSGGHVISVRSVLECASLCHQSADCFTFLMDKLEPRLRNCVQVKSANHITIAVQPKNESADVSYTVYKPSVASWMVRDSNGTQMVVGVVDTLSLEPTTVAGVDVTAVVTDSTRSHSQLLSTQTGTASTAGVGDGSTAGVDDGSTAGVGDGTTAGVDDGSTAGVGDVSTAGLDDRSTAGVGDVSTAGLDDGSTAGVDDGSTSGMGDVSTADVDDGSTAGVDGVSTAGLDDGSTAGVDDGSTAGLDDGSTAGVDDGSTAGVDGGSTAAVDGVSTAGMDDASTAGVGDGSTAGVGRGSTTAAVTDGVPVIAPPVIAVIATPNSVLDPASGK